MHAQTFKTEVLLLTSKQFSNYIDELKDKLDFKVILSDDFLTDLKKDKFGVILIDDEILNHKGLLPKLNNLKNTTIKKPKIQETSTLKLLSCLKINIFKIEECKMNFKEEIIPILNRRVVMPLFIPVITLLTSLLLIKRKSFFFNKISVFTYSFLILLYSEIILRYTGLNNFVNIIFLISPIIFAITFYFYLKLKFSKEYIINEQYSS